MNTKKKKEEEALESATRLLHEQSVTPRLPLTMRLELAWGELMRMLFGGG